MSEYNNSTVGGVGCSYATLSNYNTGNKGVKPAMQATNVTGKYIVPNYSAPGYNTLSHDSAPTCSGYFNIQGAYGGNGGSCGTKYVQSLCQ